MANKYLGVPVEIGGRPLFLRYDFNALVALEEVLGSPEVIFGKLGFRGQRALVWAGMQHEKNPLTIAEVGDLLDPYLKDTKTYAAIMESAAKAYAQAFPDAPKEAPEDDSKNAGAATGTGT